eukprot:TRINITY_DN35500_c0_g1_i3.p1 TRINITY_DN35500_c0_g1~~TRINITY_DN35500_c0_g1_i3.p1  ORF type:complete len:397 (+),score=54.60 TRINITY_DN35500_c0_g1_i3:454-1644(+)
MGRRCCSPAAGRGGRPRWLLCSARGTARLTPHSAPGPRRHCAALRAAARAGGGAGPALASPFCRFSSHQTARTLPSPHSPGWPPAHTAPTLLSSPGTRRSRRRCAQGRSARPTTWPCSGRQPGRRFPCMTNRPEFDLFLWLDADVLVVNRSVAAARELAERAEGAECEMWVAPDVGGPFPINTGVILMRGGEWALRLLDAVLHAAASDPGTRWHGLWEQEVLLRLYNQHQWVRQRLCIAPPRGLQVLAKHQEPAASDFAVHCTKLGSAAALGIYAALRGNAPDHCLAAVREADFGRAPGGRIDKSSRRYAHAVLQGRRGTEAPSGEPRAPQPPPPPTAQPTAGGALPLAELTARHRSRRRARAAVAAAAARASQGPPAPRRPLGKRELFAAAEAPP